MLSYLVFLVISISIMCDGKQFNICDVCKKLEITTMDQTIENIPKKNTKCRITAVGKPVFQHYEVEQSGVWLRDFNATGSDRDKYWTTNVNNMLRINEYKTTAHFQNNHVDEYIRLIVPFFGNGHIVYSGSFFYQSNEETKPGDIIRHELEQVWYARLRLPYAGGRLYSRQYNQVDFNADDNGLWAIYSMEGSNNTAVAKLSLDPRKTDLNIDYILNISLNHRQMGEMFIACGILYVLDSSTDRFSSISQAVDLFERKRVEVNGLDFPNIYQSTTQLVYDPQRKELDSSDKGNQLTYPLLLKYDD